MRKNMLMLLAAALLVVTGCKKDNNTENNNGEKMIFTATIDNGAKTQINGYDQVWNTGDEVSINGGKFTVTPKAGDESWATFEGQTVTPDEGGMYKAIFPSSLYNGNVYELPATQTYDGNNLSGVNPLYAESTTQELVFHNICALMKLNLKGTTGSEKVTKIEVTANEPLSGVFQIEDNKAVFGRNQKSGALTLDCGEGATLSTEGTAFYIAIPEGAYTGLTFTVTSDGGTWTYKANEDGSISVAANNLYESTQTPEFVPAEYPGLCFTAEEAPAIVSLTIIGTLTTNPVLETSTNGNTWTNYTLGAEIGLGKIGDKVYFRKAGEGVATSFSDNSNYAKFVMTGKIAASGNIMSLIDPNCEETAIPEYCFYYLFSGCTSLTTAPELPATTLASGCYYKMFNGCTSLTAAPALPATALAGGCYGEMFYGCTNLTAAPELPAETLASSCYYKMFNGCKSLTAAPALPAKTLAVSCYNNMFYGCTSLTAAPELPAETLVSGCYYSMFQGCKSLIAAPELPAETLAGNCYYSMFQGCTSLTTAPELPATTLASSCYYSMFQGCTSLTTAPELPATTLASSCYTWMFRACSSLNYIKVHFTTWNSALTNLWVVDVPRTGTFYCPDALSHDVSDHNPSKIPAGWTVKTF